VSRRRQINQILSFLAKTEVLVVKNKNMQKNFIEKLLSLRKQLKSRFSSLDMQNLDKIMSKLAHYHYDKKKFMVIGETKELYNFLIEKGYNPYTVYRWLLLERIPEDIKFQIKQKQLSQKKAISKTYRRKHETEETLGNSIKELGLNLIRRM
jgi:hypothetical protein